MGYPLQLCLVVLLFASEVAQRQLAEFIFQPEDPFPYYKASVPIDLDIPFVYAGRNYSQLYLDRKGFVSFSSPPDEFYPDLSVAIDGFVPLWIENYEGRNISYTQATEGPLITQATDCLNELFLEYNSTVTWVFVATWFITYLENDSANVTFQAVLITDDEENSYVLMSYMDIPSVQTWLAGFSVDNNTNFMNLPVNNYTDLLSTSNVEMPGLWFYSVQNRPNVVGLPDFFYPIQAANQLTYFSSDGNSLPLNLPGTFLYFGNFYDTLYINENGFQSFLPVSSWTNPDPYANGDIIAPLWTSFNADLIYYQQVTDGPLLARATVEINSMFLGLYFSASWLFITTWVAVPYSSNTGVATFQMVLVGGEDDELSFLLMNYGDIAPTGQPWLAGYRSESGIYKYTIDEPNPSDLSKSTNKGLPGQWAFRVDEEMDDCRTLHCTKDEVCVEKTGIYGCDCAKENKRPNSEIFDATETCSDSSGTVSLSRCQLFEAGYPSQFLHLSDYKCKGVIQGDRVVFNFDYHGHTCGTILMNNATHFMYTNKIEAIMGEGDQTVISRDSWLRIDISCVYPLIESISMPMSIKVEPSVIMKDLRTEGIYQIRMLPYHDASFCTPYSGDVTIAVDQQIYVGVDVFGVDSRQIVIVLDRCWATPVYDMNYYIYWNLIINECPNPEDGTTQILENGVSTSGRFSFRMFTFTKTSTSIFLHCNMHLCLVENGNCVLPCNGDSDRRRRRSLDFHDTATISIPF